MERLKRQIEILNETIWKLEREKNMFKAKYELLKRGLPVEEIEARYREAD